MQPVKKSRLGLKRAKKSNAFNTGGKIYLRWLPTLLTVSTPKKGCRRTKNEVFVPTLGLAFTVKIRDTHGIPFSFIWVYCRLLPWQQIISKITIFLLFSTYLLSFLQLASVKYLETRQSCENDFRQHFNLKKWKIYLGDF